MLDRILQFIADMLQRINNSLQTLTNSLNNKQDKLTFMPVIPYLPEAEYMLLKKTTPH